MDLMDGVDCVDLVDSGLAWKKAVVLWCLNTSETVSPMLFSGSFANAGNTIAISETVI